MKPTDEQWGKAFPHTSPVKLTGVELMTLLFIVGTLVICVVAFLGPLVNGG